MGLDLFAPGTGIAIALMGARVGGLVLVAPVFSARTIPVKIRTALVVLLTAVLAPAAAGHMAPGAEISPATMLGETLVGFTIGFGAALLVGAAETAGEVMSTQMGLSGAAIFDPLSGGQQTAIGQLLQLFTITLFLAADLHLVMVRAVAESTARLPLGTAMHMAEPMRLLAEQGGTLLALGLRFAAPVVASVLVVNVALAILGRAAPQLQIISVAFPVQIGVGLVAFAGSLPFLALVLGGWAGLHRDIVTPVLTLLAGGH